MAFNRKPGKHFTAFFLPHLFNFDGFKLTNFSIQLFFANNPELKIFNTFFFEDGIVQWIGVLLAMVSVYLVSSG